MSALIRNRQLAEDEYPSIADDAGLPQGGAMVVSWARWQRDGAALADAAYSVGVRIPNTLDIDQAWPQLQGRPLIVLEFPAFGDGRAYSQARLLRDRYRYAGEIRASGAAVVRDQIHGMQRCGIDSFVLRDDQDPAQCLKAFADFSIGYQIAADGTPSIFRRRAAHGR